MCICEISRYLKSTFDDSGIICNEVIHVADIVSTNVTNTQPVIVKSALPGNSK